MINSTRLCSALALVLALGLVACAQPATVADNDELPDARQVERVDAAAQNPPPPDAGVVHDAAVPPPDGCVPQITQLVVNPAFDEAPAGKGWTQTLIASDAPLVTDEDGVTEQTPAMKAWLGGIAAPLFFTVKDTLVQDVVIPANTTSLVLTGFYDVRTAETATTAFDTARLVVTKTDGTTIATVLSLSNLTPKTAWTTFAHAFSQDLSGQTVRIRITSTNDDVDVTSFFFDSLSLLATRGCGSVQ
jgi:hypothetical protein